MFPLKSINVAVRIDTVFSWTCIGNSSGNLKIMGYWTKMRMLLNTYFELCTLSFQEYDRNGNEIVLNDLSIKYWLKMLYKLSGRYFNAVKSTFLQGSNLAVFTIHLFR